MATPQAEATPTAQATSRAPMPAAGRAAGRARGVGRVRALALPGRRPASRCAWYQTLDWRAWALIGGGALAALALIGWALLRLRRLPVIKGIVSHKVHKGNTKATKVFKNLCGLCESLVTFVLCFFPCLFLEFIDHFTDAIPPQLIHQRREDAENKLIFLVALVQSERRGEDIA